MKIVALGIWDKLTDLDIYVDENVRKKKKTKQFRTYGGKGFKLRKSN